MLSATAQAVLRPAPTPARLHRRFPGSPVIDARRFPPHRSDGDETGLPSSQGDYPYVQRPIRRRVLRHPILDPRRLPWPSPCANRLGTLYPAVADGSLDDAYSGFTHVADRTVASAPLRTQPLDHAREHHYQGSRHLLGPDSHRQAALNLSLGSNSYGSPFPQSARAVWAHSRKATTSERRTRAQRRWTGHFQTG